MDAAIAGKFSQLLTEDQRAAVDAGRAETVETTVEAAAVAGMMDADQRRADAARDEPAAPTDQGGAGNGQENIDQAAALELHAREYEAQAEEGGTSEQAPDQLRALADDARAQAQLYRDGAGALTAADNAAASELAAADKNLNQSISADVEAVHLDQFAAEAEAVRLDRFDDRFQAALDRGDVDESVDVLLDEADRFDRQADAGGTTKMTPELLQRRGEPRRGRLLSERAPAFPE
ncbi:MULTISPECIES: hypothetical protein [unclassified Rathayibacter]|uniref:hypothetical protein n=1 Tax=unclassified Rathayibacter TaxID=2609250 RepID=UPI000CE8B711|nr:MULTISPECIES: hypothetical protein [unclassified Rathayibacter]PPF26281.1 hypothetical protein C5C54_13590 [Rathayibacter sp. AY1F2]PPH42252.1 hypothetical protein C5C42_15395 [Rathayibacter sp. AY1F7]